MQPQNETEKNIQKIIDEEYNNLSVEERQELYALYIDKNTTESYKKDLEKIIFYKKPPTPEEFLDPVNEWLTENIIVSTFDHVKENLKDILDPNNIKNMIVKYGSTRQGKTYEARLIILYVIIFMHHLREPAMYYGLSPLTRLCIYMISFKYSKTRQLYLEPMFEIMRQSPRFKQVLHSDQVRIQQENLGRDVVVWSKAKTTGEITLASGLQIQLGNKDPNNIIGSDILCCFVSEISFFCEEAGTTEEKIFELYSNAYSRIRNTVKQQYLAFIYLDSSANNSESTIEKHIINDLSKKEKTHYSWKALWEARPDLAPIWQETKETFIIITGSGNIPAQIVTHKNQLKDVPKELVLEVPIDFYDDFRLNLIKNIKDIAGRPTQSENKFIPDASYVDNIFNNNTLVNIEKEILADASLQPEKQLWDKIHSTFFYKNPKGRYSIKRAPKEVRYWGIDAAFAVKGDVYGVCCLHKEWSKEQQKIVHIIDFSTILIPGKKGISLDAVPHLILDTAIEGGLPTYAVFGDTKEAEAVKQFLDRNNITFIKQSVDRDVIPYQYFLTCMANETIKAGKNIFLSNNLKGLVLTRKGKDKQGAETIDHLKGTTNNQYLGDWEKSTCGTFAKDCSDAVCQALYGASNHTYIPSTCYEDENSRFSVNDSDRISLLEDLISTKNFY